MIRQLIKRPVAVSMILLAVTVLGIVSARLIPVSMLPDTDIPTVSVQVRIDGASAREMDGYMNTLRRELMQIPSLSDMSSYAESGSGLIRLRFEYGADMDFAFVEVNERIDKSVTSLPDGTERPRAIRSSATDIPAFFINMTAATDGTDMAGISRLASSVISKRLEQIPEVAIVDMSGLVFPELLIIPDNSKLEALGLTQSELAGIILDNNIRLGNLSIRDGQYRWNIRFQTELSSEEDIRNIRIQAGGRIYRLEDIADIKERPTDNGCIVRSDGKRAVTMAIIKQNDARMSSLRENLHRQILLFEKDYPEVEFTITRDQTELLDYTIDNLKQNLIAGILLAAMVILLFMRNFRFSLLIIPSIAASLLFSILVMYVAGMSINIISLAGLILCVGMMVDNSIIVVDNITQRWERGESLEDAISGGSSEVFVPMLSSILTNCAVFVPLVFLSGIAGEIFTDQAVAITVGLFSSLLFAVLVIPVYYYALYRGKERKTDNRFLAVTARIMDPESAYEKALKWTFRHIPAVIAAMALTIPASVLLYRNLDKSLLPPVARTDAILHIDWNAPLSTEENDRRCMEVIGSFSENVLHTTQMCGIQQFIMPHTGEMGKGEAKIYVNACNPAALDSITAASARFIARNYPDAAFNIGTAGDMLQMIFPDIEDRLVAQISGKDGEIPSPDRLNAIIGDISRENPGINLSPVQWQEEISLIPDAAAMSLYGISYNSLAGTLRKITGEDRIFSITSGDFSVPVYMGDGNRTADISGGSIKNGNGTDIPLRSILKEVRSRDFKTIVSGSTGNYYPLGMDIPDKETQTVMERIRTSAVMDGSYNVDFSGSYFTSRKTVRELAVIAIVAIMLLYLILAAQFESLVQPLIILSEIITDIFGALLLLKICGAGINAMSMIGIVVMSGIVINDSILKVDTINRLRREKGYSVIRAIMTGGARRLSPILMTTLTTVLSMVPFLTRGDIGSDLQFPLSLVMIGGMAVGLIVSIFGIPVIYYLIYRK